MEENEWKIFSLEKRTGNKRQQFQKLTNNIFWLIWQVWSYFAKYSKLKKEKISINTFYSIL